MGADVPVQTPEQLHASAQNLAALVQQHLGTSTPVPQPASPTPPASGAQSQQR